MARNKRIDTSRVGGGFVALPWSVLDSAAYLSLSYPAKALMLEVARQYVRDNNGRLLVSMNRLRPRGWNSADVLTRAKRELIDAGLIFETCKGQRPNKASWYAVTWFSLDQHEGFDPGSAKAFERGAYLKNTPLIPPRGIEKADIAPGGGIETVPPTPPAGAVSMVSVDSPIPSAGNHLDLPSPTQEKGRGCFGQWVNDYLSRLAKHGPEFVAACPVSVPGDTGQPDPIRKNRLRHPLTSPLAISLVVNRDRAPLRLVA